MTRIKQAYQHPGKAGPRPQTIGALTWNVYFVLADVPNDDRVFMTIPTVKEVQYDRPRRNAIQIAPKMKSNATSPFWDFATSVNVFVVDIDDLTIDFE